MSDAPAASPAARLFALAGALAVGAVIATATRPSATAAVTTAVVALIVAIGARGSAIALCCAGVALGSGLAGLRLASLADSALARGGARHADAILIGEALDDGTERLGAVRFVLGVHRTEVDGRGFRVREKVTVTIRPAPPRRIRAGDLLRLDTRLGPLRAPDMDARGRSSAARLERHGIAARAFASPDDLIVTGRARGLLTVVADTGRRAVRRAVARVPASERGLLLGVTIGDTSELDPRVEIDFRTTGLSHLVAVSGQNVAMVLVVVALMLRLLGAGRRVSVVTMCAATLAFCAVTRFEPSVMRAGAMTTIGLTGLAIGARKDALTMLAAATVALLVVDPFLAFEPGMQLSVLATVGILVLAPRIRELLPDGRLATVAAITLGAQLAVAPLIALTFRSMSVIAIASNIVVLPGVALATVIGLVAGSLGAIWSPLGALAILAVPATMWMRWTAHVMAALPLASIATPGRGGALAFALLLTVFVIALARRRTDRGGAALPVGLALALIVTAGGVWARALDDPALRGLVVTMLDVGQGDAILIRQGAHAMLIDGGPEPATLLRHLAAVGVRRLDLVVMSHPHADHVDGLLPIAEGFPVARALDPWFEDDLPTYQTFKAALARRRIPRDRAIAGTTYRLGNATIEVLWPGPEPMEGTPADINNNSIVLRATYGSDAVLLSGEVQEEAQEELLKRPNALRAKVVKVSHHGSARMLPEFYAATRAGIALIPVGSNTFGHPAPATLVALRGMRIGRSDRNGMVSVALDGTGRVIFRAEREARPAR